MGSNHGNWVGNHCAGDNHWRAHHANYSTSWRSHRGLRHCWGLHLGRHYSLGWGTSDERDWFGNASEAKVALTSAAKPTLSHSTTVAYVADPIRTIRVDVKGGRHRVPLVANWGTHVGFGWLLDDRWFHHRDRGFKRTNSLSTFHLLLHFFTDEKHKGTHTTAHEEDTQDYHQYEYPKIRWTLCSGVIARRIIRRASTFSAKLPSGFARIRDLDDIGRESVNICTVWLQGFGYVFTDAVLGLGCV